MNWVEIVSLVLNIALGTGFIVSVATLKATKKQANANAMKAEADAKTTELQNVESAIKIWRDLATDMSLKYDKVLEELDNLRREVSRLNRINTKIVKLLDRITPENMEAIVEQIKNEIQHEAKSDIISHLRNATDILRNDEKADA